MSGKLMATFIVCKPVSRESDHLPIPPAADYMNFFFMMAAKQETVAAKQKFEIRTKLFYLKTNSYIELLCWIRKETMLCHGLHLLIL